MKSKKVLFGLIVLAFVGSAGISSAQTKANYQNDLIEIGPDNIGGRTRAIVVDQRDASHKTLYAGAVAGGLFVKENGNSTWDYIPYTANGEEVTLPISCMVQTPDNMIYIGTGEGIAVGEHASSAIIAPKGSGLYRFNPEDNSFALVPNTSSWNYINRLAYYYRDNVLYFYVATNDGLFRWRISNANDWNTAPSCVLNEAVQDVIVISNDNMAFFTAGGHVYKVGNVTNESQAVDISATNTAFGDNAIRVELAGAHSNGTTYLYATVTNNNGMFNGVYLTNNQQNWTKITTSTIVPFTTKNNGWHNSAIAVDPANHKRIFMGGATLWEGQGFIEGGSYEWVKDSYSEEELNTGNYMGSVYPDSNFIHSGIHQIVFTPEITDGDTTWVKYIATDGGVFRFVTSAISLNKGFNTVQFNSICVAPDGSVLGGAYDNGCVFVQSRLGRDGGETNNVWYDRNTRMNHMGNVTWFGNGGQVEASMFQQITPISRRGLFFSSGGSDFAFDGGMGVSYAANYGRSYADYADYTNTQTWTSGESFTEDGIANAGSLGHMYLFETTDNKSMDSITFTIDTLNYIIRDGQEIRLNNQFTIQPGDKFLVGSPAHFYYPFEYTFTESYAFAENIPSYHFTVHNPIANRIAITGQKQSGMGVVMLNCTPTDFRKVWSVADAEAGSSNIMHWYTVWHGDSDGQYQSEHVVISKDADAVFFSVIDDSTKENFILRISGLNSININNIAEANRKINYDPWYEGAPRTTVLDTLYRSGNNYRFDRRITSMSLDPRSGNDVLLVTFGDGDETEPNVVVFNNANTPSSRTCVVKNVQNGNVNAYSGLYEITKGDLLIGTDKGVFRSKDNGASYTPYGAFNGVPVTAIRQQTRTLQRQRYIGHTGFNEEVYLFARTKYPHAVYFSTYGRGMFLDMSYCTDTTNAIANPEDYAGITNVDRGDNRISIYPNPASNVANLEIAVTEAANAIIRVYDINGRQVFTENLGRLNEGTNNYRLNVEGFAHGMYLINVVCGKQVATSKLIVR